MKSFATSLIFLFIVSAVFAQQDTLSSSNTDKKNSFTSIFYGQPGKAALYSLILPGAGQAYNKRYWKVPLVLAAEGAAAYYLISTINISQNRDACWKGLLVDATDPNLLCSPSLLGISGDSPVSEPGTAFTLRQSSRSSKEAAWIIMSAVHFLNVIEAFVDRHLINFDTTEDLSIHNLPNEEFINSGQLGIATVNVLTVRIPLNR